MNARILSGKDGEILCDRRQRSLSSIFNISESSFEKIQHASEEDTNFSNQNPSLATAVLINKASGVDEIHMTAVFIL